MTGIDRSGIAGGSIRPALDMEGVGVLARLIRAAGLICLLLLGFQRADAASAQSVFLEDLTWTELRDLVRSGETTIIVPVGGTEQSGPDMALGKHNVRVKILSEKVALALGNTLVAPVLAYVPEGSVTPPTAHMRFPGTITIPTQAFQQVLEYAARSFKLAGFRDIVLLGDHGGYQSDLKVVADRLNREWSATPSVRVHALLEYYRATQTTYVDALRRRGLSAAEIGTHAGLADTALMLATDPRLVRADRLHSDDKLNAENGVYGDPRKSSAELGQLGVDAIVAETVAAIKRDLSRP
jgi:creatinine amidohydrolase/Fe(II)-dependent formamide hydrolase-like protein